MSRRTFEANRAIAAAWEKEKQRVENGQGTRDWTEEQQQAILERGKAYDENGRAFEGQHMRSAEVYPECQGNPNNIQFLTRDEHFAAHNYNWQNPTNGYYDPVAKVMTDFGDGPILPLKEIDLTTPVVKVDVKVEDEPAREKETKPSSDESKRESINGPPKQVAKNRSTNRSKQETKSKDVGLLSKAIGVASKVYGFTERHPMVTKGALFVAGAAADALISKAVGGTGTRVSSKAVQDSATKGRVVEKVVDAVVEHAAPVEHMVKPHGQHYHTKEGLKWVEKAAFKRGGK